MRKYIVIPFFNESSRMALFENRFYKIFSRIQEQVHFVFVNDGSTDDSHKRISEFLINQGVSFEIQTHLWNLGKGAAIKTGIGISSPHPTLITDFDLPFQPKEFFSFLNSNGPIIWGRRKLNSHFGGQLPFIRTILHYAFICAFSKPLIGIYLDTQCPLKMINSPQILKSAQNIQQNRILFDLELAHEIQQSGELIESKAVKMFNSDQSSLNLKDEVFTIAIQYFKHYLPRIIKNHII